MTTEILAGPGGANQSPTDQTAVAVPRVATWVYLGTAYAILLVVLIALCASYPDGYTMPYGLTPSDFRDHFFAWQHPWLAIDASVFSGLFLTTLAGLWCIYIVAARRLISAQDACYQVLRVIVAAAVVFSIMLAVAMPPVLSSDIYRYAMFGRDLGLNGVSPYEAAYSPVTDEPYSAMTPWHDLKAEYGPAWLFISAGLARLGGDSIARTLLAFKTFAAMCGLLNCLLIWRISERFRRGSGAIGLLLYAWNPFVLIEVAGSAHNDVAMVALALMGLWLASRGNRCAAVMFLVVSALVKYLTALPLFVLVIHWTFREPSPRSRLFLLLRVSLAIFLLSAIMYIPFVLRAERMTALIPAGQTLGNATPNPLHRVMAEGFAALARDGADARRIMTAALYGGFCVLLTLLGVRGVKRGGLARVVTISGWLALIYVVVVYGALFPWYLITPIALACTAHNEQAPGRLLVYANAVAILYMIVYAMVSPG